MFSLPPHGSSVNISNDTFGWTIMIFELSHYHAEEIIWNFEKLKRISISRQASYDWITLQSFGVFSSTTNQQQNRLGSIKDWEERKIKLWKQISLPETGDWISSNEPLKDWERKTDSCSMDVQVLLVMSSPLNSQMTSVLLGLFWVPAFAFLT